jgi:hypothetical protein
VIPPGGEGEIQVTLRPKGGHPEITKNVVVLSNDPVEPRFTLTMKGTLLIDMVAQPASVSIPNLAPGEPGTASFSVERSQGSTATVKSMRVEDAELFSIREIETQPGALATYEVRFSGRDGVGTSATSAIIETTGDNTPQLVIPVRASAAYNLIYPKRITFARREGGPLEQTIRISTRRGDPPEIGKVEDPDGLLDIEVLPAQGTSVGIRMRVREDQVAKLEERTAHELVVHTSDPDEPKLELAYSMKPARPR